MEFTGVYHKTSEQMSYPKNQRELIINIKTGYDVRRVFIHYGDPFEAGPIRDANIILNCRRKKKSGIISRMVS